MKSLIYASLFSVSSLFAAQTPWNSLPENTAFALKIDNSKSVWETLKKETKYGKAFLNEQKIAEFKKEILKLIKENKDSAKLLEEFQKTGLKTDDLYELFNAKFGFSVVNVKTGEPKDQNAIAMFWCEASDQLKSKIEQSLLKDEDAKLTKLNLAGSTVYAEGKGNLLIAFSPKHIIFSGPVNDSDTVENDLRREYSKETLAQFLTALGGEGTNALNKINDASGYNAIKEDGLTIAEMLINGKPLKSLNPMVKLFLPSLGLEKIDSANIQYSYKANKFNFTGFLQSPGERQGLAQLFEQPELALQPPQWVGKDVQNYSVMSLDLNKVLDIAVDTGSKFKPQQTQQFLGLANMQIQGALGVDLKGLLGSINTTMHVLSYGLEEHTINGVKVPQQSNAMVVDFSNQEILDKIYNLASPFATKSNGSMSLIEEQGFKGFRFANPQNPGMKISLFLSHGKIILTQGDKATEVTLANLRKAPAPQQRLVNSSLYKKMQSQEITTTGIMHSFSDGNAQLKESFSALTSLQESPALKGQKELQTVFKFITALMPKGEELNNILGYSTSSVYLNDKGIVLKAVSEVPAP